MVAALILVSAMTGCASATDAASGPRPGDRVDPERMAAVAADAGATADEIVEAGVAVDADRSGDGALLVTYSVSGDDDEGLSQAAWRLYDAHGDPAATGDAGDTSEGAAQASVVGSDRGFLLTPASGRRQHLASDGESTDVRSVPDPLTTRPGDVLLGGTFEGELDGESGLGYRSDPGLLFHAGPSTDDGFQGRALAPDGTQWYASLAADPEDTTMPVYRADGDRWVPVAPMAPPPGAVGVGSSLTATDSWTAIPVLRWNDPGETGEEADGAEFVGVAVRSATAPDDATWELREPELSSSGGPGGTWDQVELLPLDDNAVLLLADAVAPHLLDLATGRAAPFREPGAGDGWSYEVGSDGIYATHPGHADARFTADRGETWERLPH